MTCHDIWDAASHRKPQRPGISLHDFRQCFTTSNHIQQFQQPSTKNGCFRPPFQGFKAFACRIYKVSPVPTRLPGEARASFPYPTSPVQIGPWFMIDPTCPPQDLGGSRSLKSPSRHNRGGAPPPVLNLPLQTRPPPLFLKIFGKGVVSMVSDFRDPPPPLVLSQTPFGAWNLASWFMPSR